MIVHCPDLSHLWPTCTWPGLGAVSIRKTVLPGVAILMLKIRRPNGRLIFNIGIAIPRLDGLYIETGPRCRTRRPSRTGSVLARSTETTEDISYSSLTATQIGSYPTLRKAIFTQCDYLGPIFGKQIKTCTHDKLTVYTETDFEGTGVFASSR